MSESAVVDFSSLDASQVLEPSEETVDTTSDSQADSNNASTEAELAETRENPDGQDDQQTSQSADKTPARSDIHKLIRSFREANPEHAAAAKILNDEYGRALAFKEVYPTVEEARLVKSQIDSIGGLDGLAQLQSTVASIEQTDSLLEQGDPQVIEQIFEDAPQGAARLAGPYLDKLAKTNPEAYTAAIRPHVVDLLTNARLGDVLNAALSSIQSSKPEDAARIIQNIQQWLADEKGQADKYKQDFFGPDRQKLGDEWKKLQSERDSDFRQSVNSSVINSTNKQLEGLLKPYFDGMDIPDAQKRDVAQACYNELGKAVWTKSFLQHVNSLMSAKGRKVDTVTKVINSAVQDKLSKVVEKVAQEYKLGKKTAKPAVRRTNAAPASGGRTAGVQSQGKPGYEWRGSRLVRIGS